MPGSGGMVEPASVYVLPGVSLGISCNFRDVVVATTAVLDGHLESEHQRAVLSIWH